MGSFLKEKTPMVTSLILLNSRYPNTLEKEIEQIDEVRRVIVENWGEARKNNEKS